jgi:energy-coupling factor transporter transmembrane protein EcfT
LKKALVSFLYFFLVHLREPMGCMIVHLCFVLVHVRYIPLERPPVFPKKQWIFLGASLCTNGSPQNCNLEQPSRVSNKIPPASV